MNIVVIAELSPPTIIHAPPHIVLLVVPRQDILMTKYTGMQGPTG
jgi:hypothetical protein